MENSVSAIAPLFVNLVASILIHLNKLLIYLSQKHRLIQLVRYFIVSTFLFLINLLPSVFSSLNTLASREAPAQNRPLVRQTHKDNLPPQPPQGGGDSGVARALSQLLLLMNDIPVSSRKYEVVRSLAEKLIDENLTFFDDQGNKTTQALREVNCAVLSSAFARSLSQLEASMLGHNHSREDKVIHEPNENDNSSYNNKYNNNSSYGYYIYNKVRNVVKGVSYFGRATWRYVTESGSEGMGERGGSSAEKLAAELLWLAQKMTASGCVEEAVGKWASAGNLAWLGLTAEPRLQGSLVKVSAFLIRQAKYLGKNQDQPQDTSTNAAPSDHHHPRSQQHQIRQIKVKMLMSWLPLLCRANNGTDSPILNMAERAELEKTLEEIISSLDNEEEQEKVLSLWLHHFTYCPASDWPNLRSCYVRWFGESRARILVPNSLLK